VTENALFIPTYFHTVGMKQAANNE